MSDRFTPRSDHVYNESRNEGISTCEAKRRLRRANLSREVASIRDASFESTQSKLDRLLDVVEAMLRDT